MSITPEALAGLLSEQPPTSASRHRWFTAQVSASHSGGVFVTELGHDEAEAHQVTWGATCHDVATCAGGMSPHSHPPTPLPRGAIVLAVETDHGVWVVRHNLGAA